MSSYRQIRGQRAPYYFIARGPLIPSIVLTWHASQLVLVFQTITSFNQKELEPIFIEVRTFWKFDPRPNLEFWRIWRCIKILLAHFEFLTCNDLSHTASVSQGWCPIAGPFPLINRLWYFHYCPFAACCIQSVLLWAIYDHFNWDPVVTVDHFEPDSLRIWIPTYLE